MVENFVTKHFKLVVTFLIIISLGFIIYKVFFKNNSDTKIEIVTSTSKFYTVSNCANQYLGYLVDKDVDNLLLLLDKNYKKNNNINSNNIFDKISILDRRYSFNAQKMYQETLNNDIVKYYLKGYLYVDDIDSSYNDRKDYYLIILLDNKNSTYSVIPYDGELFIKEDVDAKK